MNHNRIGATVLACLGLAVPGFIVPEPMSAQDPKLLATLTGHREWGLSVAYSPVGKQLVSGSLDKTIRLWDSQTGKERATLAGHTSGVSSVAYSPDGKMLASGSLDHTLKLWDVQTGKEMATLRGHKGAVSSVAY